MQARAHGNYYSWELEGSSYPFFALSTTNGGAIVVYTMGFNTQTLPVKWSPKRTLPVPDGFKPLLPADMQGVLSQLGMVIGTANTNYQSAETANTGLWS